MEKIDKALSTARRVGRSTANFEIAINDMLKFNQNQAIVFSRMDRAISECARFANRYGLEFDMQRRRLYFKNNPDVGIFIFSKSIPIQHCLGLEINGNIMADTPDCYDTEIMDILIVRTHRKAKEESQ